MITTYERNALMRSLPYFKVEGGAELDEIDKLLGTEGVYLIGETHFNPITKEELYFIKVGASSNLNKRMKQYKSSNPCLFCIDFDTTDSFSEYEYQEMLYEYAAEKLVDGTLEWVTVSREKYLKICEKGFQFFVEELQADTEWFENELKKLEEGLI